MAKHWFAGCLAIALASSPAITPIHAAGIELVRKNHDPYGSPRPAPDQPHVPLRSSFYVVLALNGSDKSDEILPESLRIELAAGAELPTILLAQQAFHDGYPGRIFPGQREKGKSTLHIYIDPEVSLKPATQYTVRVTARSRRGMEFGANAGSWNFTTEEAPRAEARSMTVDYRLPGVRWHGGFFTGFCGVSFATDGAHRVPTFELLAEARRRAPKAWSLEREFWLTGMTRRPEILDPKLPNIVRELETRRVTAIEKVDEGSRLRVEDFFGHEQYGIASNRPLADDYHAGDEVLVADGVHDARATVVRVDEAQRAVVVSPIEPPMGGWKLDYAEPLPTKEEPTAPGLFARSGGYLTKFKPSGTPRYFWRRLDYQWDLARRYNRRVVANFADAPGDLAIDGRNWTTAKDYVELHEVVRAITGHIIERYGERSLEFPWSVFNEPDLGVLFWRTDWNELQKFYDYTVDGVLRAFEDQGYDSGRVFIGGLELGGIFGTNLKLREFLVHCSPTATLVPGALERNAAFADPRLDGKRSRRVETLCGAHRGRGSPCDFVSIHAYNRSPLMADKLIRAKEMALEVDAPYYDRLWINSHESCPGWDLPPDPAYADSYLGNGYFPTWCADVARRQLARAARDPRFAYGESILTFWPWPNKNFEGRNDCVRELSVDDDGDQRADRTVTVAMPILHFLALVAAMGDELWVIDEQTVGGHVVSGFAARAAGEFHVLLYSHNPLDTESRSERSFDIDLQLRGVPPGKMHVVEYAFDKDENSYFRTARPLREAEAIQRVMSPRAIPASVAAEIQRRSQLSATAQSTQAVDQDGVFRLKVRLPANGARIVSLSP